MRQKKVESGPSNVKRTARDKKVRRGPCFNVKQKKVELETEPEIERTAKDKKARRSPYLKVR